MKFGKKVNFKLGIISMSRIGKKPITVPNSVEIKLEKEKVIAKGPKGELEVSIPGEIKVEQNERGEVVVSEKKQNKKSKALWGTVRSLISNAIEGVEKGFVKELQIKGVGYRGEIQNENLVLKVGFSHPVEIKKIEGIDFAVTKDIISVSGIKKDLVGRVAAQVRKVRPPEPYKGKGIRYKNEVVVMKEGKKSVGS